MNKNKQQKQHQQQQLLHVNVNHKNIDDEQLDELIQSKVNKLLKFPSPITSFHIEVQNNHLTDSSISSIAKHLKHLISPSSHTTSNNEKKKRSNNRNKLDHQQKSSSSSSSSSSCKFEFNFSSNEIQGRSLHELLTLLTSVQNRHLNIGNFNLSWNQLSDPSILTQIGRFINQLNRSLPPSSKQQQQQQNKQSQKKDEKKKQQQAKKKASHINILSLAKNGIDSQGLYSLCYNAEYFGCISTLLLYQNNISWIDMATSPTSSSTSGIVHLTKCLTHDQCQLTELNLAENNIGSMGAKAIANALKNNHSLLAINLRENHIGMLGISTIACALLENTTLEYLDISSNSLDPQLTDDCLQCEFVHGLFSIGKLLQSNGTLKTIRMAQKSDRKKKSIDQGSSAYIYDFGYRYLFRSLRMNTSLTSLDLRGNDRMSEYSIRKAHRLLESYNNTITELILPVNQQQQQVEQEEQEENTLVLFENIVEQHRRVNQINHQHAYNLSHKYYHFTQLNQQRVNRNYHIQNSRFLSALPLEKKKTRQVISLFEILPSEIFSHIFSYLFPMDFIRIERICYYHLWDDIVNYTWFEQCQNNYRNLLLRSSSSIPHKSLTYQSSENYRQLFKELYGMRSQIKQKISQNYSETVEENILVFNDVVTNLKARNQRIVTIADFDIIKCKWAGLFILYCDQYGVLTSFKSSSTGGGGSGCEKISELLNPVEPLLKSQGDYYYLLMNPNTSILNNNTNNNNNNSTNESVTVRFKKSLLKRKFIENIVYEKSYQQVLFTNRNIS